MLIDAWWLYYVSISSTWLRVTMWLIILMKVRLRLIVNLLSSILMLIQATQGKHIA